MSATRRVAAFVFDSPDLELVARGIADGSLPNLADLAERGRAVLLREHQELLTSVAPITLAHGCGPAEHQLVYPTQLVPGTYRLAPVEGGASARPPFWAHLGEAGRRSVIVSPYAAGFVEGLPGAQVIGWGSHDAYSRSHWRSDPPGLAQRLEREFGPRTLRYGEPKPRGETGYRDYIERMVRGARQQAAAMAALMREQEWDFFFGSFADGHQAGHYLWHMAVPEGTIRRRRRRSSPAASRRSTAPPTRDWPRSSRRRRRAPRCLW